MITHVHAGRRAVAFASITGKVVLIFPVCEHDQSLNDYDGGDLYETRHLERPTL